MADQPPQIVIESRVQLYSPLSTIFRFLNKAEPQSCIADAAFINDKSQTFHYCAGKIEIAKAPRYGELVRSCRFDKP